MRRLIHRFLEHLDGERNALAAHAPQAYERRSASASSPSSAATTRQGRRTRSAPSEVDAIGRALVPRRPDARRARQAQPGAGAVGACAASSASPAARGRWRPTRRSGADAQGCPRPCPATCGPARDREPARRARAVVRTSRWPSATGPSSSCSTPAGLRVSELVGLDWQRHRPPAACCGSMGKGGKERMVPFGRPAADALRALAARLGGRCAKAGGGSGVRRRGGAGLPQPPRRPAHRPLGAPHPRPLGGRGGDRRAGSTPHPAPHLRHPPAGGRRRPAHDPGAARPQLARPPPRSTPTWSVGAAARGLPRCPPPGAEVALRARRDPPRLSRERASGQGNREGLPREPPAFCAVLPLPRERPGQSPCYNRVPMDPISLHHRPAGAPRRPQSAWRATAR